LNNDLSKLSVWNEVEIIKRATSLSNKAAEIWAYPQVSKTEIDNYKAKSSTDANFSLEYHKNMMSESTFVMYEELDRMILSLDPGIQKEYKKWYIAYKIETNFADFETCKDHFNLTLNMPFTELNDPNQISRDVTNIGHMGNGSIEIKVNSKSDLVYILSLIKQSLNKQLSIE